MDPLAVFHFDKAPSEGSLPFLLFTFAVATSLLKRPKDIQHNDDDKKDLKDRVDSEQRQPTFLDQILLRSYQLVSATYCFDLAVIGYRLSQAHHSDSSTMSTASAKFAAWIAFTLNWIFLTLDTKVPNTRRSHVIHHLLGWTALVGAFLSIAPYLVHGSRTLSSGDLFGPNVRLDHRILLPSLTEDIFERVLIGTFALRFGLLAVTSVLSSMQLFVGLDASPLSLPASLLNSSTAPAPSVKLASESSSKKEQLERHDTIEQFRAKALDSFIPKVLLSMRMTYPMGNKKLQLLLAMRFMFMLAERVIHIMVPLQTERLLRMFSPEGKVEGVVSLSKFDVGSVLLYVFYNYLQRQSNILTILYFAAERPLDSSVRDTLQVRFFEHLHSLSMQFHQEKRSTEIFDILEIGVHSVSQISKLILFKLVPTMCDVTITILYFSIVWGWRYSLLIVAHAALIGITSKLHGRMLRRMAREMIGSNGTRRDHSTETLLNAETVKYFTNEAYEVARYKESIERPQAMMPVVHLKYQALSVAHTIIWTCNLLAGCLLCAYEISNGQRDPASFMTFVIYSQQLESPFESLTWMSGSLRTYLADMDEMMAILKLEPTVKDIPDAPPLVISGGEIEFENVSFQYSPDKRGLSNISFKVLKGQTVGIVGPTGGGKTTILRLLVRFWDPAAGRILIDGQDISKVAQLSVRKNIGAVPQDPVLFNDTIGYNINYGRTAATKEDIEAAAKVAQIHDNIMKFAKGYETPVGHRGAKLSGGERQRISIARTVLKNPPIIVMDEATSALDSMTESEIQQALNRMTKNRTTVSVAHRLSTIMHADLILYVKDGEIVERGTHEELIQAAMDNGGQGEYYKMWRIQTGRFYGDSDSTVGDNEMDTCSDGAESHKESHKDVGSAVVSEALE